MRKLCLLLLLITGHAEAKAICSFIHVKKLIPITISHSQNDNNRHCTLSCMLTLKCAAADVLAAGVLKEVTDIFGPGNAEAADLAAEHLADARISHGFIQGPLRHSDSGQAKRRPLRQPRLLQHARCRAFRADDVARRNADRVPRT